MPGSRSLAVLAAAILAACSSNPPVDDAARRVDFGEVLIGESVQRTVELRHRGPGTLHVKALDSEGPVDHGFSWDFEPFTLGENASRAITFTFRPTHTGEARSRVRLVLEGSFEEARSYELVGTGLDPRCVVEAPLFGAIPVGERATRDASIRNDSEYEWAVELGALAPEAGPFSADFAPGRHLFGPGEELRIPVTFLADHEGGFEAALTLLSGPCGSRIRLEATAARELVDVPSTVDFGFAAPGGVTRRRIAVKNPHERALKLLSAESTSPQFTLVPEVPTFIDPSGEVAFDVEFSPQAPLPYSGMLRLTLDDRGTEWVQTVRLTGSGGGPRLELEETLDFQYVLEGTRVVRTLGFRNVGFDALRFESVDANGVATPAPPVIEGEAGAFAIDEVRGMPTEGLAPGRSGQLRIAFEAKSLSQATLVLRSNDPSAPERRVRLAGGAYRSGNGPCKYALDSRTIDFGEVLKSSSAVREAVVRNIGASGEGDCFIQQVELAHGSDASFSFVAGAPGVNVRLRPGETWTLPIRFRPGGIGQHAGTVELLIGGATSPVVTLALNGTGYSGPGAGDLLVAPNDLDFGAIGVGCASRDRVMTVYNIGPADLVLDQIAVEAGMPSFTLVGLPALPLTLAAGGSMEVKVRFHPASAGPQQAAIEFTLNGAARPTFATLVSGNGFTRQPVVDTHVQGSAPKLDVLLIVDDGWTMESKRDLLRTNLKALVRSLQSLDGDWQLAVTTTSVCSNGCANGRFLPLAGAAGDRILTQYTPDPERALESLLDQVGSNGQALSQPLEAFYLATSGTNLSGHNAGFLRKDVATHVYVITDTADGSPRPVQFYSSHADSLRSNGFSEFELAAAHPLGAPEVAGCTYRTPSPDHSRLSQMLSSRGFADEVDICSDDWKWRYGVAAFGQKTRFFLTNHPELSSPITVRINGVLVAPTTSTGAAVWTYDQTVNAIDFAPDRLPRPRDIVEVSYLPRCLP